MSRVYGSSVPRSHGFFSMAPSGGSQCSTPKRGAPDGTTATLRSYAQLHRRPVRPVVRPAVRSPRDASPRQGQLQGQLGRLKQQLHVLRSEAKILQKNLTDNELASAECARLWAANRHRVCELMKEEEEEDAEEEPSDHAKARVEEEMMQVRQETLELAMEVQRAADLQWLRSLQLKRLKHWMKLQQAKRNAKMAKLAEKDLQRDQSLSALQLRQSQECCAALQLQQTQLREELAAAKVELPGSSPIPSQMFTALQSELRAEEHRSQIWRMIDASREKSQAALRCQMEQLKESLKSVQDSSGWTATQLQDTETDAASVAKRLTEARKRASILAEEARHLAASQESLQAELCRQRDATKAWRSCAAEGSCSITQQRQQAAGALETCERLLSMPMPSNQWPPVPPLPPLTLGPL